MIKFLDDKNPTRGDDAQTTCSCNRLSVRTYQLFKKTSGKWLFGKFYFQLLINKSNALIQPRILSD
jgi:hypothetical protein